MIKEQSSEEFNFVKIKLLQSNITNFLSIFGLILIGIGNSTYYFSWLVREQILTIVLVLNLSGFIIISSLTSILLVWWIYGLKIGNKQNQIFNEKSMVIFHKSLFFNQFFQFLYGLCAIISIGYDLLNAIPRSPGSTAFFFSRILSIAIYTSSSGLKSIGIIIELIGLWKLLKIVENSQKFDAHLKMVKFLIIIVTLRLISSLPILILFGIPLFIESVLLILSMAIAIKMKLMHEN